MDLPNPLGLHGLNINYTEQYRKYIEDHGGRWEELPDGQEGPGEEKHRLYFPEGTRISGVRCIRENYTQIDISFPDGGVITWYQLKKLGSPEEVHNRIGFAPSSLLK